MLKISEVSKKFGRIEVLKNVSFNVEKKQILGLLGPNGSGKTTLFKTILGLSLPTKGKVNLTPSSYGAAIDSQGFYQNLSTEKNLKIVCLIKTQPFTEIDRVLKIVSLLEQKNQAVKTFSTGMKQRLLISSALIGSPDFILLDEPHNGLDPLGLSDLKKLILELNAQGKTFLIASHLLDEMQKICTHTAIINHGSIVKTGSLAEVIGKETTLEATFFNLTNNV